MKAKILQQQNYKKCLGCGEYYDLSVEISKCENCGCKTFIACTDTLPQSAKTMDEVCGKPPGSFKKFIAQQDAELREIERERKERIRRARKMDT